MMNVSYVLRCVRTLLEDKDRWTRGHFARDANGHGVTPTSPQAVKWCVLGTIARLCGDDIRQHETVLTTLAGLDHPPEKLRLINDQLGHAHVLRALDVCIARLNNRSVCATRFPPTLACPTFPMFA